MMTKN